MRKIKMLAIVPIQEDGTSFYRATGVFPSLLKQMPELEITVNPASYSWSVLGFFDLIFMQRPHTKEQLSVAEMIKMNCKPLWVDYDDDLSAVPLSNPAYKAYAAASPIVNRILKIADIVTTTTGHLKRKLERWNENTVIIPNAFNDHMINYRPEPGKSQKLISWRGSPTHQKDVALFTPQILKLAHEHPDWTWCFIGDSYWGLIEQMPKERCAVRPTMDLAAYWHFLQGLNPSIHIVPLDDCELNRAKSNISWIEGSYAGATCVVPDWEEWRTVGSFRYKDPEHFYDLMKELMTDETTDLKLTASYGWDEVKDSYSLSQINRRRVSIIQELTGRKTLFQLSPEAQVDTQAPTVN